MFLIYGNSGDIDSVKRDIEKSTSRVSKRFKSIHDALEYLVREHDYAFEMCDLSIRYYGYDVRIRKRVYMICTCRHGKTNYLKKYGAPQFISYLIDLNEKV